jgi:transcriptional regulator with XRE-family HTH domain
MRIIADTDWAAQLRRFRRLRAIKQVALAEMLGVDQATISRWESGRQIPDLGIQRRLRALMQGAGSRDEVLIGHWVGAAVGNSLLVDAAKAMRAASLEFRRLHGLRGADLRGHSAAPIFGEELEALWWQTVERGFFEGEIASITIVSRFHLLSGERRDLPGQALWTPIHLSSGEVLLRIDSRVLGEEDFVPARERNGGPIRIVAVDDLAP